MDLKMKQESNIVMRSTQKLGWITKKHKKLRILQSTDREGEDYIIIQHKIAEIHKVSQIKNEELEDARLKLDTLLYRENIKINLHLINKQTNIFFN